MGIEAYVEFTKIKNEQAAKELRRHYHVPAFEVGKEPIAILPIFRNIKNLGEHFWTSIQTKNDDGSYNEDVSCALVELGIWSTGHRVEIIENNFDIMLAIISRKFLFDKYNILSIGGTPIKEHVSGWNALTEGWWWWSGYVVYGEDSHGAMGKKLTFLHDKESKSVRYEIWT